MLRSFIKSCLIVGICFGALSFASLARADTLSLTSTRVIKQNNASLDTKTQVTIKSATMSATGEGLVLIDPNKKMDSKTGKLSENLVRRSTFVYQFYHPDKLEGANSSRELVILLHGSGGNEASLVPLARRVWPRAVLLGIRGRVLQDGGTRWYRKITAVKFDEKDVQQEANAFVSFISKLAEKENLDLPNAIFVGYSNGANLLAATMFMHSDLVRRAVLMRSMTVLTHMPKADLSKVQVLTITGKKDKLYSPFAPVLSDALRRSGAKLDAEMVDSGHMLGLKDRQIIRKWLSAFNVTKLTDVNAKAEKD